MKRDTRDALRMIGIATAVATAVVAAVIIPVSIITSNDKAEGAAECATIDAEPVVLRDTVRFCELDSGVVVTIPDSDTPRAAAGIPPCTSDDYNKDGVPLCYVVHEPTGTVIVLDEHDERVS